MKIQLVSDLHMEFSTLTLENAGADVLVLSGDIIVAERFTRGTNSPYTNMAQEWLTWFENTCAKFERVYYVLGNHEHYYGNFYETQTLLLEKLGHIRNLVIMDNTVDRWEGFTFVGTTLWTDFDRDNLKSMLVQNGLNDYRLIEGHGYRKLQPVNVVAYYTEATRLIDRVCSEFSNVIVIGHHAPSYRSITPEYITGPYASLNSGYASNLDKFIEAHPQIKLWTHGHVHSSHDYIIGSTRVVSNPRGYATKSQVPENINFNPNLVLEVVRG